MSWYRVILPPSVEKINIPGTLLTWIHERYRALDDKKGFCIFTAYAPDFTIYFSPIAAERCYDLLKQSGAEECDAPSSDIRLFELETGESIIDCHGLLK